MANHMEEVAKMFGVEVREHFCIKDYQGFFEFTGAGLLWLPGNSAKWTLAKPPILKELLTGVTEITKLPWKPQTGELYYTPCIDEKEADMFTEREWNNTYEDMQFYKFGIVCVSQQEAIDLTMKMLEVAREWDREFYK